MIILSVCITTYNLEKYIEQTVDSVMMQKTKYPFEILIGDDGSEDNTINKIIELQKKYRGKIRLYQMDRTKNRKYNFIFRASLNRINLLKHAKGKYIIFLDGDDFYTTDSFFEEAINVLENPVNSDCVGCAGVCDMWWEDGSTKHLLMQSWPQGKVSSAEYWAGHYTHSEAIVFRNHFDINAKYENVFDDNILTFVALKKGGLYCIPKVVVNYRQNGNGFLNRPQLEQQLYNAIDYEICIRINPVLSVATAQRLNNSINYVNQHINEVTIEKYPDIYKYCVDLHIDSIKRVFEHNLFLSKLQAINSIKKIIDNDNYMPMQGSQQKKVLLLAYTNFNFGDDMFIKTICLFFPEQKFVLLADKNYKKTFSNINNIEVKTFYDSNLIGIMNGFQNKELLNYFQERYKAVVYVIGSLFDEDERWKNDITQYGLEKYKRILWKNSFIDGVPFFLLGSNMTNINSELYKKQMSFMFDGLTDVCFRDKFSYNSFSNLKNVRYAPDIVLNYNCDEKNKRNLIVISVWGILTKCNVFKQWKWAEKYWDSYKNFLVDVIKRLQMVNVDICLLAMCVNEGDLDGCKEIIEQLDNKESVYIHQYVGNIDETISLFEEAKYVIGTRFHSVVMAINAKCVLYPIIYEAKTENFLKDITYLGETSHIEQPEKYNVDNVIRALKNEYIYDAKHIKNEAKGQFTILSKCFSSENSVI